jgi:integrase
MLWNCYGMPSVHRDPRCPKGVWYCAYHLADGRRAFRSTGKRNKREAEIVCHAWQQAENEAAGGELTKDRVAEILNETLKRIGSTTIERISVKTWLEEWLSSKEQVSEATRLGYEQAVREFLEYLGSLGLTRRLEAITEGDIRGFIIKLREEGRSAGTINKLVRKYLSVPFEKARKLGKIRFNPVMATDPEKVDSVTRDTFTPEQVARLVAVADRDWQGAILLAYATGARLQDIANLRWSGLDVGNGIVTFTERKTGRKAVLGLHRDFLDWIARGPARDDPEAFVFTSLANRSGAGRNGLSRAFEAIMRRAGIEGRLIRKRSGDKGRSLRSLSFHSFRHSAASSVFNQAALKGITRRVTNHAAGGIVDRYIHHDLEAIREATKLIPRLPLITNEQ